MLLSILLSVLTKSFLILQISTGGQLRTANGVSLPHVEDGCDDQKVDYLYISEQYCSVCAQMVPRWIPTYGQDIAVLHHEEREEKEESNNGEREEGMCVCSIHMCYRRERLRMSDESTTVCLLCI